MRPQTAVRPIMGDSRARRWAWAGLGMGVLAAVHLAAPFAESDANAGTQQCNTRCQERMTDCVLGCDGVTSCIMGCKSTAAACVEVCSSDGGGAPAAPEPREAGEAPADASVRVQDARAGDARALRDAPSDRAVPRRD